VVITYRRRRSQFYWRVRGFIRIVSYLAFMMVFWGIPLLAILMFLDRP
jgi:hypothetical protein